MTDSVLLCVPGSVDGILVMLKKETIAIIPAFPLVLSGRSTSDGTFRCHNSINFDNKYNLK